MAKIDREDIHLISRYSNWSEGGVEQMLKENVYNDGAAWSKFLRLFFISLGVCFATSGIIFFFAYNWDDLHKFVKLGLVEGLVVLATALVLFLRIDLNYRHIILTGASMLVGVLFALFGQIYQTGANAYDFFLAWTLFITLWVLISNFPPLWLVYLVLLNVTLITYANQVAHEWSEIKFFTLLFGLNTVYLILPMIISRFNQEVKAPRWFTNAVALAAVTYATIGMIIVIVDHYETVSLVLSLLTLALYTAAILQGFKEKNIFYLSLIPFSLIILITTLIIEVSGTGKDSVFLLTSLFVIGSVTGLIIGLVALQKKWTNG